MIHKPVFKNSKIIFIFLNKKEKHRFFEYNLSGLQPFFEIIDKVSLKT
jgi:hypothetical protein